MYGGGMDVTTCNYQPRTWGVLVLVPIVRMKTEEGSWVECDCIWLIRAEDGTEQDDEDE